MSTISPVSSARGMKLSGATTPNPGRSHRTNASKPRIDSGLGFDERLVEELELATRHGLTQIGLECDLRRDPELHGLVEELVAGASVVLGPVHGDVGVRQDRIGRVGAVGAKRDPDACAHLRIVVAEAERGTERVEDALRERGRVVNALDVFAEHDELVAAEPRDRVTVAYRRLDSRGGLDQQLVADRVAERVVHGLEAVQVDEQHAERALVPADPRERLVESVGEHHAVRQARERVVQNLVRELSLEVLLVGEIANDCRTRWGRRLRW